MILEALIPLAGVALSELYWRHKATQEFVAKAARAAFGQAARLLRTTDKVQLHAQFSRLLGTGLAAARIDYTIARQRQADALFEHFYKVWSREEYDNTMLELADASKRASAFADALMRAADLPSTLPKGTPPLGVTR